jgi:hypothetical protein
MPGHTQMQMVDLPTAFEVDETIRRSVAALFEGRSISKDKLADVLGVSRTTAFNKLSHTNPTPFSASEVAIVAAYLQVDVSELYNGLGGLFLVQRPMQETGARGAIVSSGAARGRSSARSSTDRASDYGSVVLHSRRFRLSDVTPSPLQTSSTLVKAA